MNAMRILLVISTVGIYTLTFIALMSEGVNWPAVAITDLMSLGWRSQFDFDFIVHLLLLASWIVWREGADTKAYVFGFLSIVMGGMFSFPYIIYARFKARAQLQALLFGINAQKQRAKLI
ncbi:MAG: hypothetical protein ACI9LU_002818 [Polaribacter sp.]|jgi:hypothetical protein